jgi:hypothetical protein
MKQFFGTILVGADGKPVGSATWFSSGNGPFSFWLRLPVRDRTQTGQSSHLFVNVLIYASS